MLLLLRLQQLLQQLHLALVLLLQQLLLVPLVPQQLQHFLQLPPPQLVSRPGLGRP